MILTHNFEDVLLSVATKMPREMTCIYDKVYSAWCWAVGGGRRTGIIIVTLSHYRDLLDLRFGLNGDGIWIAFDLEGKFLLYSYLLLDILIFMCL